MSHEVSFHNWLNHKLFRREKNGNKKSQFVSNSTSYENSNNKPTPNLKCYSNTNSNRNVVSSLFSDLVTGDRKTTSISTQVSFSGYPCHVS